MKQKYPIVLVSGSPRRRQLLHELGFSFHVEVIDFEETIPNNEPVDRIAAILAVNKMNQVEQKKSGVLYITADTIVIKDCTVLGKPADLIEAGRMLTQLSDGVHQVDSAVCLEIDGKRKSFTDTCKVNFLPLDPQDIAHYLDFYEPLDKAGSYGIQDWIGMIGIEKIEGSYYTVMGLPVHLLYQELKGF